MFNLFLMTLALLLTLLQKSDEQILMKIFICVVLCPNVEVIRLRNLKFARNLSKFTEVSKCFVLKLVFLSSETLNLLDFQHFVYFMNISTYGKFQICGEF